MSSSSRTTQAGLCWWRVIAALTPRLAWPSYFRAIGLRAPVTKVNVAEPAFVKRVDSLLQNVPLAAWRAYLTYHAIAAAALGFGKNTVEKAVVKALDRLLDPADVDKIAADAEDHLRPDLLYPLARA